MQAARKLTGGQRWTLVVSCLSVALVIGSMAALYTSLPDIAEQTGATQSQLTWVVDGYTLVLAGLVLPAGAVGDRYGRRLVLILGLLVFSAASVIPLLVADPWWLISARAIDAVAADRGIPRASTRPRRGDLGGCRRIGRRRRRLVLRGAAGGMDVEIHLRRSHRRRFGIDDCRTHPA